MIWNGPHVLYLCSDIREKVSEQGESEREILMKRVLEHPEADG